MADKNYLHLIHTIEANLKASDMLEDNGDPEGASQLSDIAHGVWDEISSDLRKGVVVNTDGWSLQSKQLLSHIADRLGEDE